MTIRIWVQNSKRLLAAGLAAGLFAASASAADQAKGGNLLFASSFEGFVAAAGVRANIPPTPPLDGIFPPMSPNGGTRWEYMKDQYSWYYQYAPAQNNGRRGGGNGEAWRYDPAKTLVEWCRRSQLLGENIPGLCEDARDTVEEFFDLQQWSGECAGGITGITRGSSLVNPCDPKYGTHASPWLYTQWVYNQADPYSSTQKQQMIQYCYQQGWSFGFQPINGLEDGMKERTWGLAFQCLIDFAKGGVDTEAELDEIVGYIHDSVTGTYSGDKIGAMMHSLDGHECSNNCPNLRNDWMFSPWMSSAFLLPALWEYWVFIDKDPRVAEAIVLLGDALHTYAIVNPEEWSPNNRTGSGRIITWKEDENPTDWITLYFSLPYDKAKNIDLQNSEGYGSDQHNAQSIFALNLAYFFSCNDKFRQRSQQMEPVLNPGMASEPRASQRRVLWQHRGSASQEWLLENAACN